MGYLIFFGLFSPKIDPTSIRQQHHLVEKTESFTDKKTGQPERCSSINKNEIYRQLPKQVVQNQIPFRYVLNDA